MKPTMNTLFRTAATVLLMLSTAASPPALTADEKRAAAGNKTDHFGDDPVNAGPIANLESILKGHGVEHTIILRDAPLLGLAVVAARIVGGWLVDRVWAPAVAFVLFTLAAAASWCLVNAPPTSGYVLFGILGVGLAAGLEFDVMSFLTARYFGPRAYGGIYGTMYAFFGLGSGIAPLVYGRAFDASRSFTGIVTLGAAAMLAGGLLLLLLGPYRYRPNRLSEGPARPVADAITRMEA